MADGHTQDVGLVLVDYLIQNGLAVKDLVELARTDSTKLDDINTVIDTLLPIAYAQYTNAAGDLKTDYYYRCNVCNLKCEKKLKFNTPAENPITYCDLKRVDGALFVVYDTVINA